MFDTTYKKKRTVVLITVLMGVLPLTAFGQSSGAAGTKAAHFVNVVDTTQGFSSFGSAPAINNALAVAFESTGAGFESGSVWKWHNGGLTPIATSANGKLRRFGDVVTINSAGQVGFSAGVVTGNDSIIAAGDGGAVTVITSANSAGLLGGQFLGISGMNERGEVIFLGVRTGFRSQAIFTGKGGPLTAIVDTATDSNLASLGNADINAAGKVVFRAFLVDGTEGLFLAGDRSRDVVDTNNPNLADFLDPVINNGGTVGSAAFLTAGGEAAFTADARGITARTDSSSFSFIDNVSINNSGDIAFSATETIGGDGIFVEPAGSSKPMPVIETGDPLFGSTVVAFSIGRFCLNDDGWITFRYLLADGRSGIAVASRQR